MSWPSVADSDTLFNIVGITLSLLSMSNIPTGCGPGNVFTLFAQYGRAETLWLGLAFQRSTRTMIHDESMNTVISCSERSFKHILEVVLMSLSFWGVNKMKCNAHLHFSTFSCQSGLAPIASLLLTNRNGSNQMVCASCFHLKPLFENRVTDRMWGKTQVPVSSPLNVPFMPRHCWASPKNPLHWCGRREKKHNRRGQFTFEQWRCTNLGNRPGLMTCGLLFPADFPVTQLVENLNTASLRLMQVSRRCSHHQ